jgi:PKD repeat protein
MPTNFFRCGWGADVVTRRSLLLTAVVALGACSLDKQAAPPLAGPSELGLSLEMSATPDIITQDGRSQATIQVVARDGNGQPVRGLSLRAQTSVGGDPVDFGLLSSKVGTTGNDGVARFTYTAPPAPPPVVANDTVVSVDVIPIGTNYDNSMTRYVSLRLMRPGTIIPPGGGPVPIFVFSPTTPRENDDVNFDASASTGSIRTYAWNFGDGDTESGPSPRVQHDYALAGTYRVTLAVTDDLGRTSISAATPVTVSSISDPTAAFVVSPTPVKVGVVTNFNASASRAVTDRRIVRYRFDFGDGSPVADGGSATVQKVFGASGTYAVVLTVFDDSGRSGTTVQQIAVTP